MGARGTRRGSEGVSDVDIRAMLSHLVGCATYESELTVQTFLRSVLRDLGFETELEEVLPGRANLIGRRGQGGLLFVTHSDTFPPHNHPRPLELRAEGDTLLGRGALDAKGQIAALIKALSLSQGPCVVALTVDEETTGRGSEALTLESEGAVVLEPTELGIAVAQAGFVEARIETAGQAAHCSVPERGRNAIALAFELFDEIRRLPFMRAQHPLFPEPWANLGLLTGGLSTNVVPDRCTMQLDLAVLPGLQLEDVVAQLRRLIDTRGASLEIVDKAPPFELPTGAQLVTSLAEAVHRTTGQPARIVGMRSWTDAENLVKRGVPTVVYGAGDLALAHSDREAVSLSELETMAKTLAALIDSWPAPAPSAPTSRAVRV